MNEAARRNMPCPCGSGRRYKHCCGAGQGSVVHSAAAPSRAPPPPANHAPAPAYHGWERFDEGERQALWAKMLEALDAQRQQRMHVAARLYEEVIAKAPATFDAVHMLGAVRLVEGDYDTAEALLLRARELSPEDPSVRHNLKLLADKRGEHRGLHSVQSIVAADMLRLFAARGWLAGPEGDEDPFASGEGALTSHVVIPGTIVAAGANRTGALLDRRLGPGATLWANPNADPRLAAQLGARTIGEAGQRPMGGRVFVFGLDRHALDWLPDAAATFDRIVIALDVHDAATCFELVERLPGAALARLRIVARSAGVLDESGVPGVVHPMLFDDRRPARTVRGDGRLRLGVFLPALREPEDVARWDLLEWLRREDAYLRVLYPGRLPSRHNANDAEDLVGLATEWEGWDEGLDALFYWGGEGHWRQYDRLVFEAAAAGLVVAADGLGDYGALFAEHADWVPFFDAAGARLALASLMPRTTVAIAAAA